MAVGQVFVSSLILFLVYRHLMRTTGPEQLGVYSIVLAASSTLRISELGFSGSVIKFTAKYMARGDAEKAAEVVQTSMITVGGVLVGVLAVAYPLIQWLLGAIIPVSSILHAQELLPFAVLSVWTAVLSGILLSGLDGCKRIDLRAMVSMVSSLLFLSLAWVLISSYGLVGLAIAQICQSAFSFVAAWVLLQRELSPLRLLSFKWSYQVFREMFVYGFNVQVTAFAGLLFDPITKALVAEYGGLATTGYYEMASRMVMQFRSLLISANQTIVPQIAGIKENTPEQLYKAYIDTYRVLFYFALPMYAGLAASAPLVSVIWIGHSEEIFVRFVWLLTAGWAVNTLSGPAYFMNLGTGHLRWNTWSHIIIGVLNVLLGTLFGRLYAGTGVAMGYVLALIIGGLIVIVPYHRSNRVAMAELFPAESRSLCIACIAGLVLSYFVFDMRGPLKNPPSWHGIDIIPTIVITDR